MIVFSEFGLERDAVEDFSNYFLTLINLKFEKRYMNENTMNNAVTIRPQASASLGRIDQYELIRELGGGGFGCVYLAKDTVAGIEVAVKGLPPLVRLKDRKSVV